MRRVQLISYSALIMFAGCHSARKVSQAVVTNPNDNITMIGTSQNNLPEDNLATASQSNTSNTFQGNGLADNSAMVAKTNEGDILVSVDNNERMAVLESSQSKNIQSFAQVKAMAANGSLKLNTKQLKRLDKLDKKYHGDLNKLQNDFGDFSQTAKIIAAVGIIGLLLLLITGSFFGAFLFILAVGAFLCRWIGIFEF